MQDRDVIFDNRRLTDDNSGGMVKHDAATNFRCRVDIDLESDGNLVLQEDRQRAAALIPQPVANTVGLQGVEAFQVQQRR
ncbi:hypothetical protein D3C71_2066930 [compost metagenome]